MRFIYLSYFNISDTSSLVSIKDIQFSNILSASLNDNLLYYQNNSTGSISFSSANKIGIGDLIRNVIVGDFTDDGKPDVAFTWNSVNNNVGSLGYVINQECMTPVINPNQGIYCTGTDFFLNATKGAGVTYTWDLSGNFPDEVRPFLFLSL